MGDSCGRVYSLIQHLRQADEERPDQQNRDLAPAQRSCDPLQDVRYIKKIGMIRSFGKERAPFQGLKSAPLLADASKDRLISKAGHSPPFSVDTKSSSRTVCLYFIPCRR